jgi:arabinosaccharide transport system substrate-binding protein
MFISPITRRTFLARTGVTPIAALAAACRPSPAPQAKTELPTTYTHWYWTETRINWLKRALEDYNQTRQRPLTITWENASTDAGELVQKAIVAIAGGVPPDGLDIHINWFSALIGDDIPLAPLNDALKGREKDLFGPSGYEPWSYQGKIYGLGNELNVSTFAYRADLFAEANVTVPFRTYEDVAEAARKIKGTAPDRRISHIVQIDVLRLMIQNGGGWIDERGNPAINSPANLQVLTWLYEMTVKLDLLHNGLRPGFRDWELIVKGDTAGRIIAPPWWFGGGGLGAQAKDTAGRWRLMPMARWRPNTPATTTAGGTGVAALKGTKGSAAAIDFIIFAHTTPAILHDYDLRRIWPTFKKVIDDPRLMAEDPFFGGQRPGQLLKELAQDIPHWRTAPWFLDVDTEVGRLAIRPVLLGEKEPKPALDEAQEAAVKLIEAKYTKRR